MDELSEKGKRGKRRVTNHKRDIQQKKSLTKNQIKQRKKEKKRKKEVNISWSQ